MFFVKFFVMMENSDIHLADDSEKEMAARLFAGSDPWISLGIGIEQCRRNCFDNEFKLYLAYSHDKPAGAILIDPRGVAGSPYIKSIAVFPEFRGKGTGTCLISFTEDLFRGNAKYIFICVSSFNKRAKELYMRLGFQLVGELRDYIINGASEMLLWKKL